MDTALNKDEQKALRHFLAIYVGTALVLMSIIASLYYNKEMASMQEKCTMEMKNIAMGIEKELMHAQMKNLSYTFNPPKSAFKVALFDIQETVIHSNLSTEKPFSFFRESSHIDNIFYIQKLSYPMAGVAYIVVSGDEEGSAQKLKIQLIIALVLLIASVFVGIVGYFLSRILLQPIKTRIDKLNRFIKDSSHELNTPLSALMMSVSTLKNSNLDNNRVINHISISAKLIAQIYNSLSFIAFHDIDETYNETFDLSLLVQESAKFYEEIASIRGNTIQLELESTMVLMDKSRIQKVIHNLLSNAIKYSHPKTIIMIKLQHQLLSITDEGVGIAKEDQKNIFARFERRSTEVGGFGIGLDIVNSVCKEYGIKVWVKSKPMKGTTFFLRFPN